MKLISLAEQKPTENDIGKTVFEILKGGKIKEHILNGQESYYYFDDLPILSLYFWSKPIIISEHLNTARKKLLETLLDVLETDLECTYSEDTMKELEKQLIKQIQDAIK